MILRSQEGTGSRLQVERTVENMEIGASRLVDLFGSGGGCLILTASDFLSETQVKRDGVKFRVGKELDAG